MSATWQWAKANPDAAARRIRELERENAALREKFMLAESEIILLRVERDELREALKPFRDYAIHHGPMNLHGRNGALITIKHWQRAIYPSRRSSREHTNN